MSQNNRMNDRRALRFKEAVHTLLEPLLIRHGFVPIEHTLHVVRFDSPHVSVALFHQPLSYELDLEALYKDRPDRHFSLPDVVEAADGREPTFLQASTPDRVFQCVDAITQLIDKYGQGLLRGDAATFDRMVEVMDRRSRNLTIEVTDSPIRESAETAWNSKNYGDVKRLYESVAGGLTNVEKKRLEYAMRRLGGE